VKFAFILTVLFIACSTLLSAEASVLPAGTVIVNPQGVSSTLSETSFLLTRPDMEGAVLCQEERILLRAENQKLLRKEKNQKVLLVALPVGASLFSFLISILIARAGQ